MGTASARVHEIRSIQPFWLAKVVFFAVILCSVNSSAYSVLTHEELIEFGGIYHRLHELQFENAASVIDL